MTTVGLAPPGDPALLRSAGRALQDLNALNLPFRRGFVGREAESIAWLNGPQPLAIDPGYLTFERRLA